jgi:hypothetical protein
MLLAGWATTDDITILNHTSYRQSSLVTINSGAYAAVDDSALEHLGQLPLQALYLRHCSRISEAGVQVCAVSLVLRAIGALEIVIMHISHICMSRLALVWKRLPRRKGRARTQGHVTACSCIGLMC